MKQFCFSILIALAGTFASQSIAQDDPEYQIGLEDTFGVFEVDGLSYAFVEDPNGNAIYEGDIILGNAEELRTLIDAQDADSLGTFGVGVLASSRLWPNAEMVYALHPNLRKSWRVTNAVAHWEKQTKIKFKQIPFDQISGKDVVVFVSVDQGCASSLGRIGGVQQVVLEDNCRTGNTVHEIGHALGLHHEQVRSDRNAFVEVREENIVPAALHNFQIGHLGPLQNLGNYCYKSIMHYGRSAFAKSWGLVTIESVGGQHIGQRQGLATCDIEGIHALYGL